MKALELLAPARNKDIGIAAIDCGADAVYIAGPAFGARHAASNSLEDIAELCTYAHRFGARVFLTVNTIIYESELDDACRLMADAQECGVDALIVQDTALFGVRGITVPVHASTQCAIRDVQSARRYAALGAGRLVLERQLSLEDIREIAAATPCETECFVHGALCVCYSGQCYLSEALTGRSANRGQCAQACRSRYDLVDEDGRVLVRDKALLSLKDLNLVSRLGDLAEAGVDSFKIEGRLKNISYVRNVVRQYSLALDALVASAPDRYRRASWGHVTSGFMPAVDRTFNRGYTQLYIDSTRGRWSSMDAPKAMGEVMGRAASVRRRGRDMEVSIKPAYEDLVLSNGDGFSFVDGAEVTGFRGDVCSGLTIRAKDAPGLKPGDILYRNLSTSFERRMDTDPCRRELPVSLSTDITAGGALLATAQSEDGRIASVEIPLHDAQQARDSSRMRQTMISQLSKRHMHYKVEDVTLPPEPVSLPFMPASALNALRRSVIEALDRQPVSMTPMYRGSTGKGGAQFEADVSYKYNIANSAARQTARRGGATAVEDAYELTHRPGAELMRTRYCIKHELGLCTRLQGHAPTGPLYLLNGGRRLSLYFDCTRCEMTVCG